MVLFPMNIVCLNESAKLLQPCCCQPKDKVSMWKRMAGKGTWNPDWPHQSHCFLNTLDEMMSFSFLPCADISIWYTGCGCFGVIRSYLARQFITVQPGQRINTWNDGPFWPHSYLFSTLYQNAIIPKLSSQIVSLLKHQYGLSIFLRENVLLWQARSLGVWASLAIC